MLRDLWIGVGWGLTFSVVFVCIFVGIIRIYFALVFRFGFSLVISWQMSDPWFFSPQVIYFNWRFEIFFTYLLACDGFFLSDFSWMLFCFFAIFETLAGHLVLVAQVFHWELCILAWFCLVLWHINHYRLLNAKSILHLRLFYFIISIKVCSLGSL